MDGSISSAPHTSEAKAKWLDYDTRHMPTELDPIPEFVTVTTGTSLWDVTSSFVRGDAKGTHLDDPKVAAAWSNMVDAHVSAEDECEVLNALLGKRVDSPPTKTN